MNDLISRISLKQSIAVSAILKDKKTLDQIIDEEPTIDAVPVKHGRWIPVDWAEPRRYGCSECKRLVWELENYCPSCGARMDEMGES